jgi:hypothetical protein
MCAYVACITEGVLVPGFKNEYYESDTRAGVARAPVERTIS